MADDILGPEIIADAEKQMQGLKSLIEEIRLGNTKLSETSALALKQLSKGFAEVAQSTKSYFDIGASFSRITKFITENIVSLDEFNEKLKNNPAVLSNMTTALMELTNVPVPEYFKNFGDSAKSSLGSVKADYDKTLGVVTAMIPGVGEKLNKLGGNFSIKMDAARDAENAMLRLQAQAGDLGNTFNKFGDDLSGIDKMMNNFGNQISYVSDRTGAAPDKIRELAETLGAIPGRLQGMSQFTDSTGEKMDNLTAVLKVSRGTFHDVGKVMDIVTDQFKKFGTSQDDALKIVSRMHSATQQLNMPLANVKTVVDNASNSFKFLGDNSQSALTIMGGLAPALKKSGLGPDAIAELVSGVTDGISKLDVAQRAFISSQAGGPGGLQGAAQIQLLQQQGRSDEILNMIKSGLGKQFGGGAISLQEAAGDQGLAAQRQKQMAFLTQGPFGQLVGGEQGASRLLDAFKDGTASTELLSATEATNQAITQGEAEQKRQTTILETVRNTLDRILQAEARNVYFLARQAVGSDNKKIEEILLRSKESSAQNLGAITSNERIRATEVGIGRTGNVVGDISGPGGHTQVALNDATMKLVGTFKDMGNILFGKELNETEPSQKQQFAQQQLLGPENEIMKFISDMSSGSKLTPMPERMAPPLIEKAAATNAANMATIAKSPDVAEEEHVIRVEMRYPDGQMEKVATAVVNKNGVEIRGRELGLGVTQ
jgi:archaellum component FlaC